MNMLRLAIFGLYRRMQRLGPLLLVEILLPGGTLVALLLFLYQRRRERVRLGPPRRWQPKWQSVIAPVLAPAYSSIFVRR